jgi:protein associated with RNAse G/E
VLEGEKVRVVFRKYDGSLHWHAWLSRLGEDEHGVWLGAPRHTPWQRGSEPPVTMKAAHVSLFPRDGWWVANFNAVPAELEVYIDLSTAPTWPTTDEVTMVDLDLDVVRHRDSGAAQLLDEDEFEEHQRRYAYPAVVIDRTREAARWLMDAVTEQEPFTNVYRHWLALVTD